MTRDALIFGYSWEEIKAAQQGGTLHRKIDLRDALNLPQPTEEDLRLLREHGIDGLKALGFHGVLDRLNAAKVAP